MNFQTGLIYAVVLLSVIAIFFVTTTIVRKNRSKKQTKKIVDTGSQMRRIVDTGSQMRRLDPDKIAKGLGAERGGELKARGGHFGALQTAANRPVAPTIIPATEDFQIKLEDALKVAGLPTETKDIIGRMFQFQAAPPRSAERITVISTITGIEISNQDKGVNLFVSARRFRGDKIEHLHIEYNEHLTERDCFLAFADKSTVKGQFRLL